MSPNQRGGGHIGLGVNPVIVSVRVCVASFPSKPGDGFLLNLHKYIVGKAKELIRF